MRAFRALLIVALAAGGLTLLLSGGASAASTPKLCTALATAGADLANSNPVKNGDFDSSALKRNAAQLRKAAKSAPAKVKSAMRKMADVYDDVSGEKTSASALAEFGKQASKYLNAFGTFSSYGTKNCTGS